MSLFSTENSTQSIIIQTTSGSNWNNVGIFTVELVIVLGAIFVFFMLLIACGKDNDEKDNTFKIYKWNKINQGSKSLKQLVKDCDTENDDDENDKKKKKKSSSWFKFGWRSSKKNSKKNDENTLLPTQQSNIDVVPEFKPLNNIFYKFDTLNKFSSNGNDNEVKSFHKFLDFLVHSKKAITGSVIIHISCPGGFAYEYQRIHDRLIGLKTMGYKFVALIDDICASGGYLMAVACDQIICSQYSQIGSIGVIMKAINGHTLANKIGLTEKTIKSSKHKATSISTIGQITDEDCHIIETEINYVYKQFKEIVSKNRTLIGRVDETGNELDLDATKDVFSGNMWYAFDAKALGLIDDIQSVDVYINNIVTMKHRVFVVENKKDKVENKLLSAISKSMSMAVSSMMKSLTRTQEKKFPEMV